MGEDWLSMDLRLSSREDCVEVVIFEQLIISFSYELYDISEPSFLSASVVLAFSLLFFSSFSSKLSTLAIPFNLLSMVLV